MALTNVFYNEIIWQNLKITAIVPGHHKSFFNFRIKGLWINSLFEWLDFLFVLGVEFCRSRRNKKRTTGTQWSLFSSKSQTFGFGRKIGGNLSAPILVLRVPWPCFSLIKVSIVRVTRHFKNFYTIIIYYPWSNVLLWLNAL